MNEEQIFLFWFALHEERIRKLRDEYEKDRKVEISIRQFAEYLRLVESPEETLNLN